MHHVRLGSLVHSAMQIIPKTAATRTVDFTKSYSSFLCVSHLFVNLCKLVQVILKKGNLLLLGARPPAIIRFHFGTLRRERRKSKMRK